MVLITLKMNLKQEVLFKNTSMMNTVFIAIKESLRLYLFNHQKNMEKKFMNYCLITVTIII
ncbi:hypothetical protein BLK93_21070 [Klebsiella pneumoniae]|nr:hypothetical protein BLK93_21070 [Klebsiella pneumoniae]